ncbi:DEAD/DEAH box helicase [Nesterenkonia sphaerica]|uniref:DEAD/DEAH box helicase n=1 Tax=Nesterenkonia sphaerica TaxID=1804988 RepID=UPI001FB783B2|nr:DEAD/DEAH box helicase [Nesterenkonia sphaerica]
MTEPTLFDVGTDVGSQLPPAYPHRAAHGTAGTLRQWQQEALDLYIQKRPKDFMAVATPGAGKTTFALRVAKLLVESGEVNRIYLVVPTEHLKRQWADAAARVGLAVDPNFKNSDGRHGSQFIGVAVTYAQVANKPALHRNKTEAGRTLVIFDEIHHAGDSLSWGDGVREAFDPAVRRLALTGTPFRSDTSPIPFVTYAEGPDGVPRSRADYSYGYGPALKDLVVRPVVFMAYSGNMRWRTASGEEMEAQLGGAATKDITQHAWRTALNPEGEWIPAVLRAAHQRLMKVRDRIHDAGGLVIATDHEAARAYAAQLDRLTGQPTTVVLSDDKDASRKIEQFSQDESRYWMVAVRMVSEGVDVPRLCVGVYATSTSTPLFFAQAVGRFVRLRKKAEVASVFLPSVPVLTDLANAMEAERDHALAAPDADDPEDGEIPEADLLQQAEQEERASAELAKGEFAALGSSAAFDRVMFDGEEFGLGGAIGSEDEMDFLGIPGLLEPEQVSQLLRRQQAEQLRRRPKGTDGAGDVVDHRQLKALRSKLNKSVSAYSAKTGMHQGSIHTKLRDKCGGPPVGQATQTQLEARLKQLQLWFVSK